MAHDHEAMSVSHRRVHAIGRLRCCGDRSVARQAVAVKPHVPNKNLEETVAWVLTVKGCDRK